ncbi:MAG TPA: hypothetical protein VN929_17985 [Burkholderiales bacterium]|nr:hypothetical protein [Burkholderiales bacterium]
MKDPIEKEAKREKKKKGASYLSLRTPRDQAIPTRDSVQTSLLETQTMASQKKMLGGQLGAGYRAHKETGH